MSVRFLTGRFPERSDEQSIPGPPPEPSVTERLIHVLESHVRLEANTLERYREIEAHSKNPLLKFLLQLVISDEEKHHAIIHAIVSTLKGNLTWTSPEGGFSGLYDLQRDKEELLGLTEDFIQLERDAIAEYRTLAKVGKNYYRGLFVLLFRCVIRDSEKHKEILEFLRRMLKEP